MIIIHSYIDIISCSSNFNARIGFISFLYFINIEGILYFALLVSKFVIVQNTHLQVEINIHIIIAGHLFYSFFNIYQNFIKTFTNLDPDIHLKHHQFAFENENGDLCFQECYQ